MYSVYADDVCIYNDIFSNSNIANGVSPTLEMSDNTAGTFTITLTVGNPGYDSVERLATEIVVKREGDDIWAGRVISEETDFYNSRMLTCEGELAYLNDTTQPSAENSSGDDVVTLYSTDTSYDIYTFLETLINVHNSKVGEDKQFTLGAITVEGELTYSFDDETTLDIINEQLLEEFGGHIRVRRVYDDDGNLIRYLDYLADYPNTNAQTIRFGQNLLDFTKNWDMSDLATVVVARGAQDDDVYLDVSEVNGGSRYVTNEDGIRAYGWIEVVVDWDEVTDASELLELAEAYLSEEQFDEMTIEVSAVDLRYLYTNFQSINLLDQVRVISTPHGMNKTFPVTKLSIQLDSPENSTYTLGDKVDNSFTSSTRKSNEEILDLVDDLPDENTILEKAKYNATQILNMATQGYVTIITNSEGSEALYISSESATTAYDYTTDKWDSDVKLWKWNVNGLGYSLDGGRNYDLAITMDGSICADFITTGTMSAARVRTGILKDENGNVNWNLNTGILTMTRGSILLGKGLFSVTDEGYLTAERGKIGGFTIDSSAIYNSSLRMDSTGFSLYYGGELLGSYSTSVWNNKTTAHGITTQLENDTAFISWGHMDAETDDSYTIKLMYASESLIGDDGYYFTKDRIHLGCDIDGNGWLAYHFWLDPNTSGVNNGTTYDDARVMLYTEDGGYITAWLRSGVFTDVY